MNIIVVLIAVLFLVGTHYIAYTYGQEAGKQEIIKAERIRKKLEDAKKKK